MQAITTKWFAATDIRGARLSASCVALTIYVDWDDDLDFETNHANAAMEIVRRLRWSDHGFWFHGQMKDGRFSHVCTPNHVIDAWQAVRKKVA